VAATATEEFVIPRREVVAAHYDNLAIVGRVHVDVLLSQEKQGRYVTVVSIGRRSTEPLVRIQSSCLYGETFGSLGCDCGDQLNGSLARMRAAGSGILVYLDQEGRGAGLAVKALAYELAERLDLDTFGAYAQLGFAHDLRSYVDAVRVLKLLEVSSCILLTNNPAKVQALEDAGITTRRQPLWVQRGAHAHRSRAVRRAHGYLE
jgi:3,4-dihydroxy 2-butanone 4-phosphate synthase/GTP cyclohydrolase II